ncbi:hypothetical protein AQUCO_06300027v1 [Aquilegia coerulea]|uniref:Uncharacterized protein n=1 Tax=Aquilegia coerulea TaxID=218851 RepID=A0A2G5CCS6_AQUCA|nr:hypothetical protein AQUCO_06300027v1 [Aquilegia coerulea]
MNYILSVSDMGIGLPAPKLADKFTALNTLETVWKCIMDDKSSWIAVSGMGGIGKTTIMKAIHDRLLGQSHHLFDKVVWLTVSLEANIRGLQDAVAEELGVDISNEANELQRKEQLLRGLKQKRRIVLILDDVWPNNCLDKIGIPKPTKENGWKLLVTTRSLDFCKSNGCQIFEVENLSKEEAWQVFMDKVGVVLSPEVRKIARWIVEECHGLPLAIVAVAGAMRGNNNINDWVVALNDLRREDGLIKCLKFAYDRLPSENLKKCFLYCALFPEDYLFKPEELIRYWMAENFIQIYGGFVAEIDEGFQIQRELQKACMLQMFTKGGHDWLKMHDIVRDMAIQIVREEWAEAGKISMMRENIERLDDNFPFLRNGLRQEWAEAGKVSTLLLHDNPISYINPSFFFRRDMFALTFLDLSYSWITELPPSLSELAPLRVLFLQYCRRLQKVPSVEMLKNLQVLNLRGTSITELPQGMEELIGLKSLDLSETVKLASIHVGVIASLFRLEELRLQGSGLCKMDSPVVANYLVEMMTLKRLAILTLSLVGYGNHLDSIICLQEQNHKIFSVDVYGSTEDYIQDEETL